MHNRCTPFGIRRCLRPISTASTFQVRTYGRSPTALIDSLDKAENGLEEELEAVFVFHRHGDRTPGRSLVTEDLGEDESNFWKTKIPPALCYDILCQRFPAIHQSNSDSNSYMNYESFSESSGGNRSYGFLTWKGMHQMYHNGVSIANKYTPTSSNVISFRDHWDVKAVSTNYLRTVMSCQAFLDGLLMDNKISAKDGVSLNYNYPTHYERIPLEEYRAECDVSETLDILVRDDESETLNAFEASPKLMKKLMGDVFATPEFIANDQKATSLKSELIDYLPGLVRHGTYAETPSPSSDTKINWIHATDHFVCRSSHSVDAQTFCPHLQGARDHEAQRFTELGAATVSHLQQRFHGYYSDSRLLGEMAGPALQEVVMEMKEAVSDDAPSTKKPFRIYSCHDVTILALLYAIEGRSLDSTQPPPQWPTYATCLTLELVRRRKSNESDPSFVIRGWLNEAPIPAFSHSPVAFHATPDHEPSFSIDVPRFERLVRNLNDARVPKDLR